MYGGGRGAAGDRMMAVVLRSQRCNCERAALGEADAATVGEQGSGGEQHNTRGGQLGLAVAQMTGKINTAQVEDGRNERREGW